MSTEQIQSDHTATLVRVDEEFFRENGILDLLCDLADHPLNKDEPVILERIGFSRYLLRSGGAKATLAFQNNQPIDAWILERPSAQISA